MLIALRETMIGRSISASIVIQISATPSPSVTVIVLLKIAKFTAEKKTNIKGTLKMTNVGGLQIGPKM